MTKNTRSHRHRSKHEPDFFSGSDDFIQEPTSRLSPRERRSLARRSGVAGCIGGLLLWGFLSVIVMMMAFGMVVIAGIVGSGGLGETIYGAVRKLDIALSVNAAIAIVILTIILDRVSQSAGHAKGRRT